MKIKRIVGLVLVIFFSFMSIVLIAGLIVPQSVLLKFSSHKTSDLPSKDGLKSENVSQASSEQVDLGATNASSTANTSGTTSATGNTNATTSTSINTNTQTQPMAVAPTLTFAASPTTVTAGATSVLSWSINTGATSPVTCTASGGWSGTKATSGSENKSITSTSSYTLTCSNSAGQASKSVTVTVSAPAPTCGSGGSCTLSQVAAHNSASDCWVIIAYTAGGGNGTGRVYKLASGFFGSSGQHSGLPGAPSISASSWCGKNISSTFNGKHSGGNRSDGSHNAVWWLTNNGNSYVGDWSGN